MPPPTRNLPRKQSQSSSLRATRFLRATVRDEILTFPIRPGLAYVGRSTLNEIVLNDSTISQRHASIEYSRTGVLLKDLGSTNGTYVAGQPVNERWLSVQDSVQFGGVHCSFIGGLKKASTLVISTLQIRNECDRFCRCRIPVQDAES